MWPLITSSSVLAISSYLLRKTTKRRLLQVNKKEEGLRDIANWKESLQQQMLDSRNLSEQEWENFSNSLNDSLAGFMEVMFIAFENKSVTYDDVLHNTTSAMWTFPSALFFSATVITTIGWLIILCVGTRVVVLEIRFKLVMFKICVGFFGFLLQILPFSIISKSMTSK